MNRQSVSSSNLRSVGHDGSTLEVEFRNGSVYQYSGVPKSVSRALLSAGSKGGYFNDYIRDRYPTRRIR